MTHSHAPHDTDPHDVRHDVHEHVHEHGHQHGHQHGHGHLDGSDFSAMAELLDLDAEVFHDYLHQATTLVREQVQGPDASPRTVRRVADVGCGTGAATLALARHFPGADLFPVDVAEPLLDHLMGKARAQSLAERVHPAPADLDQGWPPQLHDLDLVWASASVHHVSDPERCLRDIRAALVPGGWLALVEVDDLNTFHPTFLTGSQDGPGGVEARVRAALTPAMTAGMPYLGADWPTLLAAAGFTVEADRVFDLAPQPPLPDGTGRYAQLTLQRMRDQLQHFDRDDEVAAADLAALDELLADGPHGIQQRDDLAPRARRHLWLARRP